MQMLIKSLSDLIIFLLEKILKFKKKNINKKYKKLINSLFSRKDYLKIKDPRKW